MNTSTTVIWIIVAVLIVLLVIGVIATVMLHRSHQRLRGKIALKQGRPWPQLKTGPSAPVPAFYHAMNVPDTLMSRMKSAQVLGPEADVMASQLAMNRMRRSG